MREIKIEILNWEKYQRRGDIKSPWWFAVHNELWRSGEFSIFSSEEKVVWYALLGLASKERKPIVACSATWFAGINSVQVDAVFSAIEKAKQFQWIRVIRTESVRDPNAIWAPHDMTVHNITIQNKVKEITVSQELKNKPIAKKKSVAVTQQLTAPSDLTYVSPRATEHSIENLALNLSQDARDRIQRIYPDHEFVNREVEKMKVWLEANSRKMPKSKAGWTRFVMGWLERGWERYRKGIPSAKTGEINWDKIFGKDEKNGTRVLQG